MAKKSVYYGPIRKKRGAFGEEGFKSAKAAYSAYERARLLQNVNPTLAPKDKFSQIWGWETPESKARKNL